MIEADDQISQLSSLRSSGNEFLRRFSGRSGNYASGRREAGPRYSKFVFGTPRSQDNADRRRTQTEQERTEGDDDADSSSSFLGVGSSRSSGADPDSAMRRKSDVLSTPGTLAATLIYVLPEQPQVRLVKISRRQLKISRFLSRHS